MVPGKRQVEQSLKRHGFSATDAKRYVAYWSSKGLLDPENWDQDDNFIPDMKRARTSTDPIASLLMRADMILQ
jgi:hypothetical protein